MKHSAIFGKIISAVTASSLFLAGIAVFPEKTQLDANAAGAAVIDTTDVYQTIRGFGGINLPEWVQQGDMTAAQVQKAFGNGIDELGLTILRVFVNDDSSQWSRAVPTALAAQKLGATVFASPWNPPASMRSSGGSNGKYIVNKNQYGDYAKHLNSYIKFMEGKGVNLYSISVQNEPD